MDANVGAKISKIYNLHVGALTAERVKNEIGTLSPTPRGSILAEGSSTLNYQPAGAAVRAADLTDCIRVYINKVIEYATAVLWQLPAEVAAAVNRNGVYLSGGVMKISQVPQYIGGKLNMRYHVCDEPQFATVLGGGVLLQDRELLNNFSKKEE